MLKLTFFTKFSYGVGQISQGVKDTAFQSFVVFYFSQVLGMPAIMAGFAALIALLVDAITDPLMGDVSDNWHSKWGRRHPFMIAAVIPFPLSLFMLFSPPAGLDQQGLFLWLVCWSIIVRVMLTLFNVPHNALGAELSKDYQERTKIVSYRTFLGYVGGISLSVIALNTFFKVTEQNPYGMLNAQGYSQLGLLAAVIAFVAMVFCILGTKNTIAHLPKAPKDQKKVDFKRSFRAFAEALKLRPFRLIFIVQVLTMVAGGAGATFMLYIGSYFFALSPAEISLLTLTIVVGLVPATIIAPVLSKKIDKMPSLVLCLLVATVFSFSPIILRLLTVLPENGSPMIMPILFSTYVVGYSFFIAAGIIIGSMLADVADLHATTTRKRQEGIFFAANSFAQKATFGLGTLIAGIGLDVIAFPKQVDVSQVSAEALFDLGMIAGPVPMLIYLISAYIATKYDLNKTKHTEICIQLNEQKN
ncbi:MFS transporter [Thalassotalea sp. Y01]|uniref:MFS transporter n=1 Tax=Thalassotalea sp. Y01 TaxID=2729613 RepID=UPI00145E5218|nr:MFS transporter [Thalassotalea sp. Y01]NMP15481.1 MFS transporter [Thalassotalea sp. Y01]